MHELWFPIYFRLEIGREAAIWTCCRLAACAAQRRRPSLPRQRSGEVSVIGGRVAATGGAWPGQGGRHAKRGSRLGPAMLLPRGNLPRHRGACVGRGCEGAEGVVGRRVWGGRRWRGAAPHNLHLSERTRGYCPQVYDRKFNRMPANGFLLKISYTRKPVFVLMLYFVSAGVF